METAIEVRRVTKGYIPVSEGLSSVETNMCVSSGSNRYLFQKDLVVWKRIKKNISMSKHIGFRRT